MSKPCERCGTRGATQLYGIGIYHADGRQEGEHVADIELRLCEQCIEAVADDLLWFRNSHSGAMRTE